MQQLKVSSKGGLVVSLKELINMHRVGMKYKINHRTKDLITFRNFLNKEINKRMKHGKKENTAKNQKPTQD